MALGVRSAQQGRIKALVNWLIATGFLGTVFLVVKYFEYSAKWERSPGPRSELPFRTGEIGSRAELFFSLYFAMTGMHALHMVVGLGLLVWLLRKAKKGHFSAEYYNPVENLASTGTSSTSSGSSSSRCSI